MSHLGSKPIEAKCGGCGCIGWYNGLCGGGGTGLLEGCDGVDCGKIPCCCCCHCCCFICSYKKANTTNFSSIQFFLETCYIFNSYSFQLQVFWNSIYLMLLVSKVSILTMGTLVALTMTMDGWMDK